MQFQFQFGHGTLAWLWAGQSVRGLQRVRYAWSTAARRLGEVGARAMRRARMERKVGLRWERPGVVQAFGFVLFRRLGGWVCG